MTTRQADNPQPVPPSSLGSDQLPETIDEPTSPSVQRSQGARLDETLAGEPGTGPVGVRHGEIRSGGAGVLAREPETRHRGPEQRRVRRSRAAEPRGRQDRGLCHRGDEGRRTEAGFPRQLPSARAVAADGDLEEPRAAPPRRRPRRRPGVRLWAGGHAQHASQRVGDRFEEVGGGLRRLRGERPRTPLERLRRDRCAGKDRAHPDQRPRPATRSRCRPPAWAARGCRWTGPAATQGSSPSRPG